MQPESLLLSLQGTATFSYPKPEESSPTSFIYGVLNCLGYR